MIINDYGKKGEFINNPKKEIGKNTGIFIIEKKWGHEEWIVNSDLYCMKNLVVKQNQFCSIHLHKNKTETFFIQTGFVKLELWENLSNLDVGKPDKFFELEEKETITIPPNTAHRFTGLDPTNIIIEISTHHEDSDSYRYRISDKE